MLLISALVLLRLSVSAHPQVAGAWLTDSGRTTAAAIGLDLVPFAGIAFLWFIGVIRTGSAGTRTGSSRPVFLGSGLLSAGMLFVAAAVAGGLIAAWSRPSGLPLGRTPPEAVPAAKAGPASEARPEPGSWARWVPRTAVAFADTVGDASCPSADRSCGYISFFTSAQAARAWACQPPAGTAAARPGQFVR